MVRISFSNSLQIALRHSWRMRGKLGAETFFKSRSIGAPTDGLKDVPFKINQKL